MNKIIKKIEGNSFTLSHRFYSKKEKKEIVNAGEKKILAAQLNDCIKDNLNPKFKVGMRVMGIKNQSKNDFYMYNGMCGVIKDAILNEKGDVKKLLIQFDDEDEGVIREIRKIRIDLHDSKSKSKSYYKAKYEYEGFGLTIGDAITVHKAQGKTFNAVVLDSSCLTSNKIGQSYVALSRCRYWENLFVLIDKKKVFDLEVKISKEVMGYTSFTEKNTNLSNKNKLPPSKIEIEKFKNEIVLLTRLGKSMPTLSLISF